ncbi:flagellar filament capping protein FliD [Lacrimispora sp.]|jgi:flagellar hook-associated protein 2|uniref:flagellar filament capping protein FliD n=1 Tax=Lacrimispora sp. TaxID=2719234 RepID=UPI0028B13480|nr:flagellar filament capping protein FliD [Lacrimispora sp.]
MASVYNSVTNSSYSSSVRGFGGLASGLDRDSLIEGMTAATRAKIAKQEKSKQTLLWKQDTYRSISTKLIEFSAKYTSYTNPDTNISSAAFWARSSVTPIGTNSKYVQVSGSPSNSSAASVVGVKQLAQKASVVSGNYVTEGKLSTGEIDLNEIKTVSTLEGESLKFQIGNKTFNVPLKSGTDQDGNPYDFSNGTQTVKSITKALEGISIGGGKTLADMIEVTADPAGTANDPVGTPFKLDFKSKDTAENEICLAGGSLGALKALGIENGEALVELGKQGKTVITASGMADELTTNQNLFKPLSFQEQVDGKKMSFTYNGVTKSILLSYKAGDSMADLAKDIEGKLAKEFGTGRIEVKATDVTGDKGKLQFTTQNPDGTNDRSSDLAISSADSGVIGKGGALNVAEGESNRLRMNATFLESGLNTDPSKSKTDPLNITINGVDIKGLTYGSSISEIVNKINASDAGVTVSYLRNADRFSIVSKEEGASGKIEFNAKTTDGQNTDNVKLFGSLAGTQDPVTGVVTPPAAVKGEDAVIYVKYGDSSAPVELTRGSNSFNLDGLNVTVSGTFNETGVYDKDQEVTFNAKTDTDKIVKAISDMIKDYNDIIKQVNDQVSTRPNRKYEPLTDQQKEQMKDSQIEKWEEEAKKGLLFNDPELRSLSDSLRFVLSPGSEDQRKLESFGISTSKDYSEQGSLVLDETKFRAALENSAEDLKNLFIKKADKTTGETGGFMSRLTTITDNYASTKGAVKGSLIEKAGSAYSPNSILSNTIKKSIDGIDSIIERLQSQLQTETDRYVKQFTTLETLISQMNSQSSWLSSVGGQ